MSFSFSPKDPLGDGEIHHDVEPGSGFVGKISDKAMDARRRRIALELRTRNEKAIERVANMVVEEEMRNGG
jgi:hypothetical protein